MPSTTLRELTGMPATAPSLAGSTLIMVDCQNTYTRGVMELEGVQAALDEAEELLDRARSAGTPVIHIQHDAGEGSPYDVRAEIGAIVDRVAPRGDEPVVVKGAPNAFVGTDLHQLHRPRCVQPGLQPDCRRGCDGDPFAAGPGRRGRGVGPSGGEPGRDRRPVRGRRPGHEGDPRLSL